MELNQLKQLLAVAENGTISKAAEKLSLSQPALSRSLRRLEEELGVSLFDHHKNKVVMNETGKTAVQKAADVLKALDAFTEETRRVGNASRTIRIAACSPAPVWDLKPLLEKAYPGICVEYDLFNETMHTDLLGKYDLLITPEEPSGQNICSVPYLEEDLYLAVPKNHPFAEKNEVSFSEINGTTLLVYANIGFWHDIHERNLPDSRFLYQNERETFRALINGSDFPSFTTNLSLKREGEIKGRIAIPISDDNAHVTFFITMSETNRRRYAVLLDLIENYYEF